MHYHGSSVARQVSLAVEETGISAEHMRSTGVAEEVLELDAPDGIVVHVTISPPIQLQKPMLQALSTTYLLDCTTLQRFGYLTYLTLLQGNVAVELPCKGGSHRASHRIGSGRAA